MKRAWIPAIALLFLSACGGDPRAAAIAALEGDAASGAPLYATHCASCHGDDGSGDSGPALVGDVHEHSDEELASKILGGGLVMPGFADELGDQEVADLIAFLHSL